MIESKPAKRVPVHYRWDLDPPPVKVPERLTLRFRPGTVIGGRVVDESGPIADAKVEVLLPATQSEPTARYFFHAATVATDVEGRWRCDVVPADLAGLQIFVEHAEYLPGQATPEALVQPTKRVLEQALLAEANVVRLEQGVALTGRVLGPEGKPIAGARAAFGRGPMECSHEPETTTDADGRFELPNCRKGASGVTVQADGFAPQMIKLVVGPEAKPLEFRLEPANTLRVRAVDPNGEPLVGVSFLAYQWPADSSPAFHAIRFHGLTDAEGRLAWTAPARPGRLPRAEDGLHDEFSPDPDGLPARASGYPFQVTGQLEITSETTPSPNESRGELQSRRGSENIRQRGLMKRIRSLQSRVANEFADVPRRNLRHRNLTRCTALHNGELPMPRPSSTQPTEVELQILRILWELGPSPVREIHRRLEADKGTNYSTTVKMLSVMLRKGLLKRNEESQPHIYRPALSRAKAGKLMVHELIDKVYGGSAMSLVLQALSAGTATKEELGEIRRLLDQMEGKQP